MGAQNKVNGKSFLTLRCIECFPLTRPPSWAFGTVPSRHRFFTGTFYLLQICIFDTVFSPVLALGTLESCGEELRRLFCQNFSTSSHIFWFASVSEFHLGHNRHQETRMEVEPIRSSLTLQLRWDSSPCMLLPHLGKSGWPVPSGVPPCEGESAPTSSSASCSLLSFAELYTEDWSCF
jgi:hypothetical protein